MTPISTQGQRRCIACGAAPLSHRTVRSSGVVYLHTPLSVAHSAHVLHAQPYACHVPMCPCTTQIFNETRRIENANFFSCFIVNVKPYAAPVAVSRSRTRSSAPAPPDRSARTCASPLDLLTLSPDTPRVKPGCRRRDREQGLGGHASALLWRRLDVVAAEHRDPHRPNRERDADDREQPAKGSAEARDRERAG